MNVKYFKLVPCTAEEIISNPQQAFVSVGNLRAAGFIFNMDNLIQQVMKEETERH